MQLGILFGLLTLFEELPLIVLLDGYDVVHFDPVLMLFEAIVAFGFVGLLENSWCCEIRCRMHRVLDYAVSAPHFLLGIYY